MVVSSYQRDRLHTMGGSLLAISAHVRKLAKILNAHGIFAQDAALQEQCQSLFEKTNLAVEKTTSAFIELRRDIVERSEAQESQSLISCLEADRSKLESLLSELRAGGIEASAFPLTGDKTAILAASVLVIAAEKPISRTIELCKKLRLEPQGEHTPFIIVFDQDLEPEAIELLKLGNVSFYRRDRLVQDLGRLLQHIAVWRAASLCRSEFEPEGVRGCKEKSK